ncbi:MAG TPA: hypothetical protein PKE16_14265, partial [Hyphomicrobium sp.]|nr:hypothetical protein [Hyphomicrobium sp.]
MKLIPVFKGADFFPHDLRLPFMKYKGPALAASIIASRALTPIEGAIEGWNSFTQFLASFVRVRALLQSSPFNFQRLLLPA